MITRADLAELEAAAQARPDIDGSSLQGLESVTEVLAFVAHQARSDGNDEANHVELVVRLNGMSPSDVRASARVLASLGYTKVADRLKQVAGRRRRDLRPLGN